MKRGEPLKRGKPLRTDPEKVKTWLRKPRSALKQKGKLARASVSRERIPGREYDYQEFWLRICTKRDKDGSRRPVPCIVCGSVQDLDAHHVIAKQRLKRVGAALRMEMPDIVSLLHDRRNGVSLCRYHHDQHESRNAPLRRSQLPETVTEFAEWLDSKLGTEECVLYLENTYGD